MSKTIKYKEGIEKVRLAIAVEGDPKAPFSIATTPRFRGGCYSWIALLYLWSVPGNAGCKVASSTIFLIFGMCQPGIKPQSPGSLVNT